MPTVAEHWKRIITWCDRFAPFTAHALRPPTAPAGVAGSPPAPGADWPRQVREFFTLHNGAYLRTRSGMWLGSIVPHGRLLSLDEALAGPVAANSSAPDGAASVGSAVPEPAAVPLAVGEGRHRFVVAAGRGRHEVTVLAGGGTPTGRGLRWASPAQLLAELANALETGTSFARRRPVVVDRRLTWAPS
ncbi:hypothetical protein [Rhodococcus ruber]